MGGPQTAAASLARLVRRIFALVWEVPLSRPSRPWTLPIAVIAVSLLSLALSSVGLESQEWPLTLVAAEALIEFVIVALIWLTVTRFLPRDPAAQHWRHFLPGAVLFAAGFVAMKITVIVYLAPKSELLTARYGSVATAVVLLTWAYLIGFIVVASADLNAAVFRSLTREKTSPRTK